MSYLVNDPATFVDDMVKGFVAAHGGLVRSVPGGVVRRAKAPGQVAVVVGGGSGHYPAFAGLVGAGLAHGAAMGNVFASPSAHQVYSVAKAVHAGAGVLLTYGNYAGDVLNFDRAEQRLRAEGVACRTVLVTDDVSSAPVEEADKRRGVAGDLFVFKIAAAAAEAGASLDEVVKVAHRANARTRTLGVAFSGCTLPGADEPLFTMPPGRMGVGMGIHGEPGIEEADLPSADALAGLLVDRLVAERPDGSDRAVVLVNGLGAVKSEELFVLYGSVADRLALHNVTVVQPEVGELVTSFEMAGVSLTLCWLDDQLERLWAAPALTPAYRKGTPAPDGWDLDPAQTAGPDGPSDDVPAGSPDSQRSARTVVAALAAAGGTIHAHVDELGHLDAVAGDGDHGIGMQRGVVAGLAAAEAAVAAGAGAGTTLCLAGDAWADRAGGTSGALWGLILNSIGERFGDERAPDVHVVADAVARADRAVQEFGKARPGDKTLVDTLDPFARELAVHADRTDRIVEAWAAAASVADEAARGTAALVAKVGRARPHAEKSRGVPDPGAVSMALIIDAVGAMLLDRDADAEGGPQGGRRA